MKKQRRATIVSLGCALSLGACAGLTQDFAPVENTTGYTLRGYKTGVYEVQIENQNLGEVEVWSAGAYEDDNAVGEPTILHVGFRVEALGDKPLKLNPDTVELTTLIVDDVAVPAPPPTDTVGGTVIEPGDDGVVSVFFQLPEGISPQDVDAFRVKWKVQSPEGEYTQQTPFVEYVAGYYGPYYYGYYDTYLYPYGYYRYPPYYAPYGYGERYNFVDRDRSALNDPREEP